MNKYCYQLGKLKKVFLNFFLKVFTTLIWYHVEVYSTALAQIFASVGDLCVKCICSDTTIVCLKLLGRCLWSLTT